MMIAVLSKELPDFSDGLIIRNNASVEHAVSQEGEEDIWMNYAALGSWTHAIISTPYLDRLLDSVMRFIEP